MLIIDNLQVSYNQSQILHDLNMQINAGQFICLIGRNGAGKTTLLKTIIGILSPASGQINYNNQNITKWPSYKRARAGIGYVPQGRGIFPFLTVEENLLMGLEYTDNKNSAHMEETYKRFPALKKKAKAAGGTLSGGQQQQLAFARALICKPRLLLLDEPTEGIQPSIVQEIEENLLSLHAEGETTILLVEQYLEFALGVANYCYVMDKGSFVVQGVPSEINQDSIHQYLAV